MADHRGTLEAAAKTVCVSSSHRQPGNSAVIFLSTSSFKVRALARRFGRAIFALRFRPTGLFLAKRKALNKTAARSIVEDWQPIKSAPEGRILQVLIASSPVPGSQRTPSLAIRRGNKWVWYPGEIPCRATLTHWMDVWAPGE